MLELDDDETQSIEAALERAARIEVAAWGVVERWKSLPLCVGILIEQLRGALEDK